MGSIDSVNPVYIDKLEQIHAVDGIAVGDSINRMNLLYLIDVDRIHRIDQIHDVDSIDPDPV